MSNDFTTFRSLPATLQKEAIREGERRLDAQLQIATAADQRALAWSGLLVAAVTAALGGGLALASKSKPDYALAILAIGFAGLLLRSAWIAISTVQPTRFHLPGNTPANWKPDEWDCTGTDARKAAVARADQAASLAKQIDANADQAVTRAQRINKSFTMASKTIAGSGTVLLVILIYRVVPWSRLAEYFCAGN